MLPLRRRLRDQRRGEGPRQDGQRPRRDRRQSWSTTSWSLGPSLEEPLRVVGGERLFSGLVAVVDGGGVADALHGGGGSRADGVEGHHAVRLRTASLEGVHCQASRSVDSSSSPMRTWEPFDRTAGTCRADEGGARMPGVRRGTEREPSASPQRERGVREQAGPRGSTGQSRALSMGAGLLARRKTR